MRTRRAWMLRSLVGALSLWAAPVLAQVDIIIDDSTPEGTTAVVNVRLAANGASVGGMQNDIIFDNTKVFLAAANSCVLNSAIGLNPPGGSCIDDGPTVGPCKNLSRVLNQCGGTPQAQGCPEGAGTEISVFRGIIAATAVPNNNEIPDGILYTCTFNVVGTLPTDLTNSNVVVSNPTGTRLDSAGTSGTIGGGGEEPTPTPTEPVAEGLRIVVGTASGVSGSASIDVSLVADGNSVGGMQNDIIFDNTKVQLAAANSCVINPAIGLNPPGGSCIDDGPEVGPCKNLSRVLNTCGGTPQAQGCPEGAGSNISVFRGIIAATAVPNNNEIPDGVLYTCTFTTVPANLPATLTNSNVVVSNPTGTRLDSTGVNGAVLGDGPPPPTDTPAPPTVAPTNTQVPPTNTQVPPTNTAPPSTATATATEVTDDGCATTVAQAAAAGAVTLILGPGADCFPEAGGTVEIGTGASALQVGYTQRVGNTLFLTAPLSSPVAAGTAIASVGGAGDDDDGCHINARATNSNAWVLLLLPALGLLALRGRRW